MSNMMGADIQWGQIGVNEKEEIDMGLNIKGCENNVMEIGCKKKPRQTFNKISYILKNSKPVTKAYISE